MRIFMQKFVDFRIKICAVSRKKRKRTSSSLPLSTCFERTRAVSVSSVTTMIRLPRGARARRWSRSIFRREIGTYGLIERNSPPTVDVDT